MMIVGCAALHGCARGPELAKLSGTVTFEGKPLPKATMVFEGAGVRPATVRVENGAIVEATTFKEGDGVPVGPHKVAVSATTEAASAVVADPGSGQAPVENYMSGKSLIPARYNDPATSGLTADIKPGDNRVDFKLKLAP
jgi:hypothetical protein